MKKILVRVLSILFYPLIRCHQIIMDAPIICCDNALIGYGTYHQFSAPEHSGASGFVRPASHSRTGWVCHAR